MAATQNMRNKKQNSYAINTRTPTSVGRLRKVTETCLAQAKTCLKTENTMRKEEAGRGDMHQQSEQTGASVKFQRDNGEAGNGPEEEVDLLNMAIRQKNLLSVCSYHNAETYEGTNHTLSSSLGVWMY